MVFVISNLLLLLCIQIAIKILNYLAFQCISAMTFIRYAQHRKIRKPNNLALGAIKPKWPKQDSQNQLRSPMPEGEEP
jgi:hypothetical protein